MVVGVCAWRQRSGYDSGWRSWVLCLQNRGVDTVVVFAFGKRFGVVADFTFGKSFGVVAGALLHRFLLLDAAHRLNLSCPSRW